MDFLLDSTFLDTHAGCSIQYIVMKITTVSVAIVKPVPIFPAARLKILSTMDQAEVSVLYTSKPSM
jgi:hypothetical protein